MIETAAAALGILGIGMASYALGQWRSSGSEGCNGHHWEEPDAVTEVLGSKAFQHVEFLEADVGLGTVELKVQATKECEDCGKNKCTTITVGEIDWEEFGYYEHVEERTPKGVSFDR